MKSSPPEPVPPAEPAWLADAVRKTKDELRRFVETAWACTRHPAQFASEWASGTRQTLNPVGFLATSAAILGPWRNLFLRWSALLPADASLLGQLYESIQPFILYAALGFLCHPVLRLAGSRRRLSSTVAIALYVGGGPAAAAELVQWPMILLLKRTLGITWIGPRELHSPLAVLFALFFVLAFLVYFVVFARGLAGLHGLRWFWPVIALLVAMSVNVSVTRLLERALHHRVASPAVSRVADQSSMWPRSENTHTGPRSWLYPGFAIPWMS